MDDVKYKIESGEQKAWRELLEADPAAVSFNSLAEYDQAAGTYALTILGERYAIDPRERSVTNVSNPARRPEYLLNLSVPIYMVQARPVPPSGELVKELKGGDFFFRGSHTLPVDAIASRYARDRESFLKAGAALGGTPTKLGDAGFLFRFFPRVEMAFVLWLEDEEFPARVSLLFDGNADRHMALDVVWAAALVSCQRMLAS